VDVGMRLVGMWLRPLGGGRDGVGGFLRGGSCARRLRRGGRGRRRRRLGSWIVCMMRILLDSNWCMSL